MTIKNDNLHTSAPCLTRLVYVLLMTSQFDWLFVDDVTQWLDICDAITWKRISNLLDIDFIHDDIPGWSSDPSYKSHHVSDKYPTMHHFVTEMCTHVHR